MKAAVIYWSGTGNTEQMAQAIADAAGAELFAVSDFSGSIADYDRIAFGCSAMGDEVLEEDEFEPFFSLRSKATFPERPSFVYSGWGDSDGRTGKQSQERRNAGWRRRSDRQRNPTRALKK